MRISDSFNYEFVFGQGLGEISFDMDENELYSKLKSPGSTDSDVYEKGVEETKRDHYPDYGLLISKSMYDGIIDPLKIFTKKLIVAGSDLYSLKLTTLRKHIVLEHDRLQIEFLEKVVGEPFETEISYPRLGLTVWFENEKLIDACIEKPDIEEL